MTEQQFDVFLCHNSEDKPAVVQIAQQLQRHGLQPWLDIWELRPGLPWQKTLEEQISQIKSAAVFIGQNGIGPWQDQELQAFLREFVRRECPVIPVLLPSAANQPKLPIFLAGMMWVDFRQAEPDPMKQMIWGITGQRPQPAVNYSSSPTPLSATPLTDEDNLSSEQFGTNYYARLRDLLICKDWKAADQETINRMCEVMNRKRGWLRVEDIDHFPCRDLLTIDQLWVKYSNGRFGFSVQTKIWQDCGSPTRCNHDLEKFGETVGWRTKGILGLGGSWLFYLQLTFDESAPYGHLPWFLRYTHTWDVNFLGLGRSGGMTMSGDGGISHLALRLIACNA